jgi:hypothetical protein
LWAICFRLEENITHAVQHPWFHTTCRYFLFHFLSSDVVSVNNSLFEKSSRPFFFFQRRSRVVSSRPIRQYGEASQLLVLDDWTSRISVVRFRSSNGLFSLGSWDEARNRNQTPKITVTFMRLPFGWIIRSNLSPKFQNFSLRVDGGLMPVVETESLNRGDQTSAGLG